LEEMVNLEKLVGRIGPDIYASGTNDSEKERGVQVLLRSQLNCRSSGAKVREQR
jgi:hypothetical protein